MLSSKHATPMIITGTFWLILFLGLNVSAFHAPGRVWQRKGHVSWTTGLSSLSADVEAHGTQDAPLVFSLNSVVSSDPVPAASPQAILEFFQDPAQRNCMLSAGNEREVEETQESAKYYDLWKIISREQGATEPDESDPILRVASGGMNFPGLTLTPETYIGAKLLDHSDDEYQYPVYEFTFVFDTKKVEGFKIAVWIFNKLTGADDEESKNKAVTRSLSKVTAITTDSGETVFQVNMTFTTQVFFPQLLLRILPVSKEKAEQQGSAAIGKALEKDLNKAMQTLRQQFLERLA